MTPKDPSQPPSPPPPLGETRIAPDSAARVPSNPSSLSASQAAPIPGAAPRFGRYELLGEIARGGMGVVYRAKQTDMQRTVALKVLLSGDFASAEEEKRFMREAELAGQLSHPNIVAVHDLGMQDGRRYFTMELVEGRPLDKWARERPLEERLRVVAKACRAVHHAHMKGIIHRDLKPGNILVTHGGEPKILDFGLAKATAPGTESLNTMSGAPIGTPFYMSPEQAAGRVREIDIRTDVYALGVILYEVTALRLPFRGDSLMEVLDRIQKDDPAPLNAPGDLRLVIAKAMEKEKSRRYPTAEALAEDVERFLAGDSVSARPPSLGWLVRRWARRHPAAMTGVAVSSCLAAGFLAWIFSRPGYLEVSVEPGEEAWIEVDGARSGPVSRLSPGRHRVRVGAPRHETGEAEVDVGRGERRALPFRLRREKSPVFMRCDTEAAVAVIDGVPHGLPMSGNDMPTGRYRVELLARGRQSLVREMEVDPGRATSVNWPDLPAIGYWARPITDASGEAPSWNDINGDGIRDLSFCHGSMLRVYDGRTGEYLRETAYSGGPYRSQIHRLDLDGDGMPDDLVVDPEAESVLLQAFSAAQSTPASSAAATGTPPSQKLLWEKRLELKCDRSSVLRAGTLWLGLDRGVARISPGNGEILSVAPLPAPASLALAPGGVAAASGSAVVLFREDGSVAWRTDIGAAGTLLSSGVAPEQTDGWDEFLVATGQEFVALDASTGRVAGRVPVAGTLSAIWTVRETGSRKGALAQHFGGRLRIDEVSSGRRLLEISTDGAGLAFGLDQFLFYRPDRVDALSLEGRTLWTLRLPAPIYQVPARWTGPPAPEWQFLTEDKSLWSVGDSGAVLRRVRLAFLPTLVCPAHTDGDGRVDSVLLGYGVQRAPSTRTLWARSLSNNGRARPVAVQVGDSTHVLYQDRWDDTGTKSLRSFDGKTGREIWRLQAGMDPIRAPTLHDWDRDGSPEAWIFSHSQGGVRGVQVVRVSDGSILATFPEPIDDPYAPVVPVDADGDGSLEAAVFGYRHGYRLLGRDRPEPLAASRVGAVRPPLWTPVLADVDGDRRPEILCAWVGESDGAITALRTDGTVAWQLDVPDDVRSEPALADLDADGAPELLVSGRRDIFVLSLDGRLRSTWAGCGSGLGGLSILDVDGDGRLEVLHATTTGAALLRADGSAVWRAPDARIRGRLSVAETPSGRLALGVDRDGRLHALDLATGKPRWFADLGGWSEGGPTIADVTGDGIPEALVAGAWLGFVVIDLR